MKTFKEYITEIKLQRAKRLALAASKKQTAHDDAFNAFHNIMGSGPVERLVGIIKGGKPSDGGEQLFRKADQGLLRQIYKGGTNPKNVTQHAKNVLEIGYPRDDVRPATMGRKMKEIKSKMARVGRGDRGHPFRSSLHPEI